MSKPAATSEREVRLGTRSVVVTGVLLGIGLMGAMDTIVFHQFLQWHHLYVHTTDYWRIFSDGIIHTLSSALLFIGALRLWWSRRLIARVGKVNRFVAALFFGMGGFQLFDGIINHMVLGLHPVREGVENLLPYNLAWNGAAFFLLVIGYVFWGRAERE